MKQKNKSDQLRKRAEELLAGKENLQPAELAKNMEELVESLQIYQFELEIQNEELVRVQQSLEKSKNRFESLFNNAPVAYCILNLEGVIQEANHGFFSLLTLKSNELPGKNLSQFVDHLSQDDFYLHLRNAKYNSQGYTSTIVFNANGGKVYVKLHSQLEQLIDEDEKVMLCTLNDITSEVNFSEELKNIHIALTERHKELNCLYYITALGNDLDLMLKDYMEECIKLIPSGFTQPENTLVRITAGDEIYISKSFKETRLSLSSDIKVNNEIIGKIDVFSDNQQYLESDKHFIDEEKSLLGAIADHISYIIKRNRDGEEINQQNYILKRLNAEKDKLFSVIGHDLRGPMSNIMGLTGILESNFSSFPPEKGLKILKGISQTANNIYQLLENLLEWAGFQRGTMVFRPEKVNLLNLVESVLEFFDHHFNAKQIYMRLRIHEDIFIKVDENMVLSTLRNLISNAIKFTNRHGEISITAEMSDNGNVIVAVADNGIGMEPKIIENLFNIERNVGREGTENEPSSGLGLILCKGFIEKHNGKIWVESQVGKGSIFYFSLPVA